MVPPDAFSMSAAQACVAGTSGCAGGTHSDTFRLTTLSCANAGVMADVTLAANSNAKNAGLIGIISLGMSAGLGAQSGYLTCYLVGRLFQDGLAAGCLCRSLAIPVPWPHCNLEVRPSAGNQVPETLCCSDRLFQGCYFPR